MLITGDISYIDEERASSIIDTRKPIGKYLYEDEDGIFVAIDNTTGDAWTEEFSTLLEAEQWLYEGACEG